MRGSNKAAAICAAGNPATTPACRATTSARPIAAGFDQRLGRAIADLLEIFIERRLHDSPALCLESPRPIRSA